MARKKKRENDEPIELQITNKMIRFGGDIYPLRNISHVRSVVIEHNYENPVGPLAVIFALVSIGCGVSVAIGETMKQLSDGQRLLVIAGLIGLGVLILWMWWKRRKGPPDEYGVQLATNAGAMQLFSSENKDFIEQVVLKIVEVIEHTERNSNVTVNIADQMIHDHSVTQNITYDLRTQHLNLNAEDSAFLLGTFQPALERLAAELQQAGDKAALQGLERIADEINSEKPDGGVIRALWQKVSSACSAYDTVKTASDIATMVGRVAMMFATV